MPLVAIEANIAAGKSTLIPKLCKELNWTEVKEPVDEDPEFARLLSEFTSHPEDAQKRIEFQKYVTNNRAQVLEGVDTENGCVIERSLFSDLIFSQTNFLSMERPDASYMDYYYDIKRRLTEYPQVDAIIYLRTTPEVVHKRLIGRGREAECGTPLEYIEDLHAFHEACLPQICREYNTELITVEWDQFGEDLSSNPEHMLAELIKETIK